MANDISVSIDVTYHKTAVDSAIDAAFKRALEECGKKAEQYAKDKIHNVSGELSKSITHKQEGKDTEVIGTNVSYAPYVEFGHRQQPGRFVPAIKKRLVKDHAPAYPYLKPALEDHIPEYKKIVEDELKKI